MDIYRYFHPHHNPRLFGTPLRQQELSELEQASAELRKAIERARLRTERVEREGNGSGNIQPQDFDNILAAVRFLERSLQILCDAHEGDTPATLETVVAERLGLRGWEAWTRIVMEQLTSEDSFARDPELRSEVTTREKAEVLHTEMPVVSEETEQATEVKIMNDVESLAPFAPSS